MRTAQGFTLMEMLVTLAIITVLASISFPLCQQFQRKALSQACVTNLQGLGVALNSYLTDHNMMMPKVAAGKRDRDEDTRTIVELLADYVPSEEIFHCPADREGIHDETGTSYFWNSLLNGQSAMKLQFFLTKDEVGIPIFSDKENFHEGLGDEVNILYADGHVSRNLRFRIGS